ncbi:MAG TPA: hypothetical protein VEX57_18695 [Microlunatus sp.]|nr:hypothetical protein [Microlunatus sp.]
MADGVTTPAQWAELVTTALLGTDRRPVDAADPPLEVLRLAARHRVLDRLAAPALVGPSPSPDPVAGPSSQDGAPPDVGAPPQDRPEAPGPADRLLDQLLRTPDPALISCWLGACAERGRVAAPIHWTALARLAARSTGYDRVALGAALGPRGRWFLRQNPDWRRLAADAERSAVPPTPTDAPPTIRLTAEDVLADPERLLSQPLPWGPDLVAAAYAVLGGDGQVPPARTFATRLGVALPAELYPTIARAGEFYVLSPDASPARRRTVRDRFVALEYAAYARAAIQHAFTDGTTGFTRAEIPHV